MPKDYAQQMTLLAYMKRKKVDFKVSEPKKYPLLPPVTLSDEEMERIEKSIASGYGSLDELKEMLRQ